MDSRINTAVEQVTVDAFDIPTVSPESDGTHAWNKTTLVTVHVRAAGETGLGYTYNAPAAATLIRDTLAQHVVGCDALFPRAAYNEMVRAVRNSGRPGIASAAIAAADVALHDLKARLLGIPLVLLSGTPKREIPVYGSGGFTSYAVDQLCEQLAGWASEGIGAVKMKIGTDPSQDFERVRAARGAIGAADLYVDANGAYQRKQALKFAERFADLGVSWFEEPVSSDDIEGLRLLRDRAPAGINIAAGEYGYDVHYFRRMLLAGSVDVLQIDGTRCGGVSGFLDAAALSEPFGVPVSAHTAPSLHGHLCCMTSKSMNVEYFFDHVRIEQMLFDGALRAVDGKLTPDLGARGLGLTLRQTDAEPFRIFHAEVNGGE